jgi:tRNA dimethylallyltransferase
MSAMSPKTAVVILGPTASGKTAAAIQLALQAHTAIISADSRQCYREMTIGVAKPSPQQLATVHHYFIDTYSIHDRVDAAVFEKDALRAAREVFADHDHVVVTGGTGLYVKVFCEGIDELPPIDESIRKEVREKERSVQELQQWLEEIDPSYLRNTHEPANPVRLMRAIEVKLSSGRSILEFRTGSRVNRDFRIRKIGIEWPRETLYARINQRVDEMFDAGLLEEARGLYPHRHLQALQTVGYQEVFEYLEGKFSLDEAREKIKQHTRNYAKRQMTWFRKDPEIEWKSYDRLQVEGWGLQP